MTVAPNFHFPTGGPGDLGLGTLAAVIRYGYATGDLRDEDETGEGVVYSFAAWLHGTNAPPARPQR